MKVALPLDKMTVEEKIQTMENIWEDLCKNPKNIVSPSWHEDLLINRENELKNGSDELEYWESARRKIQDSIK